jgi:hypothetical protein
MPRVPPSSPASKINSIIGCWPSNGPRVGLVERRKTKGSTGSSTRRPKQVQPRCCVQNPRPGSMSVIEIYRQLRFLAVWGSADPDLF